MHQWQEQGKWPGRHPGEGGGRGALDEFEGLSAADVRLANLMYGCINDKSR